MNKPKSKFYETPEFKKINTEWKAKLKTSEFEDIERADGSLKDLNRRTISFDNRDQIRDFFLKLSEYLQYTKLSKDHRQILSLYAEGVHIRGPNSITEQTGWSDKTVRIIISKHKKIILGQ